MIEAELRALPIAYPGEPDLEARVLARLERRRRRWLVPVVVAAAAVAGLMAIPQTRAAILDFFRIGGVTVERVETQPRAPVARPELGRPVDLAEARALVDFPLLVPRERARAFFDGEIVSLTWDGRVLSQWRAEQLPFFLKQAGPASRVVNVSVDEARGVWITGARHEVVYRPAGSSNVNAKQRRLAGNVLIWDRDGITYRLEGVRTLAQALSIVRNLERG